ncbi:hypothetical protein FPHOBKDP_00190 [Listeria phage LPJP1]|nr:hypothetical protein FPHOBKDP_00190 [Listeria phage LPJP1]
MSNNSIRFRIMADIYCNNKFINVEELEFTGTNESNARKQLTGYLNRLTRENNNGRYTAKNINIIPIKSQFQNNIENQEQLNLFSNDINDDL